MLSKVLVLGLWTGVVFSAPTAQLVDEAVAEQEADQLQPRATYPFNKIIAFGDDMTDNGQGSYAHHITGNQTTGQGIHLWGANTWTDGFIAATYLAGDLAMPLTYDYAFGSSLGAQTIGSVCDSSLIPTSQRKSYAMLSDGVLVPDVLSQIKNYTSGGVYNKRVGQTLHYLWTGNNDMIASIGYVGRFTICSADKLCIPGQEKFIVQVIGCMETALTNLIASGAKYILVPSVYPRHLSPWTSQYISSNPGMIANFGNVINVYNKKLRQLCSAMNAKYAGVKVMYYDANAFLVSALGNPALVQGAAYNTTCVDGCYKQVSSQGNFGMWYDHTLIGKQPDQFYWMTSVVPSTAVHKALAANMATFLARQF